MSEAAAQHVRLYTFGTWASDECPQGADPTPLGARLIAFLEGSYKGPLSEREAELLHQEFCAMETYRQQLHGALLQCSGALQQEASNSVRAQDGPYRVSHSYESGRMLGQYTGYAAAAQMVQNIINTVAIATHEANDKLTAERMAKLEEGT